MDSWILANAKHINIFYLVFFNVCVSLLVACYLLHPHGTNRRTIERKNKRGRRARARGEQMHMKNKKNIYKVYARKRKAKRERERERDNQS